MLGNRGLLWSLAVLAKSVGGIPIELSLPSGYDILLRQIPLSKEELEELELVKSLHDYHMLHRTKPEDFPAEHIEVFKKHGLWS